MLVLLLCAGPAARAAAQSPPHLRIARVEPVQGSLVELTVDYATARDEPAELPALRVTIGDRELPVVATRSERLPVEVLVVTDLSARMSDRSAFSTRFEQMTPLVKNFVNQLQAGPNIAGLVVFSETVQLVHKLAPDLQAIVNTLDRGNQALLFEPAPLASGDEGAPYALGEAGQLAVAQLVAGSGEAHPKALVIFAAGGQLAPAAVALLRDELARARAEQISIRVVVFGFGSSASGSFERFPAGSEQLQSLAETLDGNFFDLGDELFSVATRQRIEAEFAAITARGTHTVLTVDLAGAPAGAGLVRVATADASAEAPLDVPVGPPQFVVQAPTRWEGPLVLSITPQSEQAPIVRVEYRLDNYRLGEATSRADGFALSLDAASPAFQRDYGPGPHTLTAVAFDAAGAQSEAQAPLEITVAEPPAAGLGALGEPLSAPIWWLLAALATLVVVGGTLFMLRRSGAVRGGKSSTDVYSTAASPPPPQEEPTTRYGKPAAPDISTVLAEDDRKTRPLDEGEVPSPNDLDEKTTRLDLLSAAPSKRWYVELLLGVEPQRFELRADQRHYDLGRPARGHNPHIAITSPIISRFHAKLERFRDRFELIALETENGTFVGEECRRMEPDERVDLKDGDVFWLSQRVKLRLMSEPRP